MVRELGSQSKLLCSVAPFSTSGRGDLAQEEAGSWRDPVLVMAQQGQEDTPDVQFPILACELEAFSFADLTF